MPTYDYRCDNCKKEFEVFQSMLEDPLAICSDCQGTVRRLISRNVGIAFKGSGFYVTDSNSQSSSLSSSAAPSS